MAGPWSQPVRERGPLAGPPSGSPARLARSPIMADWASRLMPRTRNTASAEPAALAPSAAAMASMPIRAPISAAHHHSPRSGSRPHSAPPRDSRCMARPWPSPMTAAIAALTAMQAMSVGPTPCIPARFTAPNPIRMAGSSSIRRPDSVTPLTWLMIMAATTATSTRASTISLMTSSFRYGSTVGPGLGGPPRPAGLTPV